MLFQKLLFEALLLPIAFASVLMTTGSLTGSNWTVTNDPSLLISGTNWLVPYHYITVPDLSICSLTIEYDFGALPLYKVCSV